MRKPNYPDSASQEEFCNRISEHFKTDVVTNKQINEFCKANGLPYPYFLTYNKSRSAGWGKYRCKGTNPVITPASVSVPVPAAVHLAVTPETEMIISDSFVPPKDPTYVPFGFYTDLKNIINSKIFYPIYITGLSGNGKTLMALQVAACLGREVVRVNITKNTDELDLFGAYELVNGNTVRREGPVLTAMRRGAILLLDETDYGSEHLLCLQPVLEGKPFLDKKTNTVVYPQPGFQVIATANTKGKGSSDGRFIGANVLNEAFLERFAITVEQEYPNADTETKILQKNFKQLGLDGEEGIDRFIKVLVEWADQIRRSYQDDAVDEVISTRRLVHIAKAYAIFKNKKKAIKLCLNRFDAEVAKGFLDLYDKLDVDPSPQEAKPETVQQTAATTDIEYVPLSGKLTHAYKKAVIIKNELINGTEHLSVYSHGNKSFRPLTQMPSPTQVNQFEDMVRRLVENNMVGGTTI